MACSMSVAAPTPDEYSNLSVSFNDLKYHIDAEQKTYTSRLLAD